MFQNRLYSLFRPLPIALYALAASLLLGAAGPMMPGLWQLLAPLGLVPLVGLAVAGGAGLLACHLAQLTVVPLGRAALAKATLPAVLISVAAIPGMGAPALLPPLALAAFLAWQSPEQRGPALLAFSGAAAGLLATALHSPLLGSCAAVAMLGAAWLSLLRSGNPAGNDNPTLERIGDIWRLPEETCYATQVSETRDLGHRE